MSVELPAEVTDQAEAANQEMSYAWHRVVGEPDDSSEWEAIEGADTERYVLTAEDVWRSVLLGLYGGELPPAYGAVETCRTR